MNETTDNDRTVWNVRLWIFNEEPLYRYSLDLLESHDNDVAAATEEYLDTIHKEGITNTPDGYRFTYQAVFQAFTGLKEDLS